MNRENLMQGLKLLKAKIHGNARENMELGCSATPAPTPTVSVSDDCNTGVGAGLYNNQVGAGAGVKIEEVKMKDELQHRGKPPVVSLTGRAGFSTPFPEGVPFGDDYFLNSIKGGRL